MKKNKELTCENDRTVLQTAPFVVGENNEKGMLLPQVDNLNELNSYTRLRKKRVRRAIFMYRTTGS